MKTYIYTLSHPDTNEVRYVGKTVNIEQRLYNHIRHAKSMIYKRHICYWVNSLLKEGKLPVMNVIEESDNDWESRERHWIAYYRESGANLCNHTDGGEGRLGSRLFDDEDEIIQLITDKLNSGLYFQFEIEDELSVHRGYISNLVARRGLQLPKGKKKKTGSRTGIKLKLSKVRKNTGRGYSIVKGTKPYRVMHYVDGVRTLYGYFKTEQEAIDAVTKIRTDEKQK